MPRYSKFVDTMEAPQPKAASPVLSGAVEYVYIYIYIYALGAGMSLSGLGGPHVENKGKRERARTLFSTIVYNCDASSIHIEK